MYTILLNKCMCIIVLLLRTCLQLGQYTQIRNVLWEPDYAVDRSISISIDWHANPSPRYPKNRRAQRYAFKAGYRFLAQP